MSRRIFPTLSIALIAIACAAPAIAQSATPAAPNYDVSWTALDPGQDWAAEVIKAVFPINGSSCNGGAQSATCTGSAATVIGELLGRFTGFSMALGMFYVCYLTIWNIYRTAETSNLLTNAMTSMFVVRIGFAAIMMFPITSGFSIGQAAVVQTSMWGIGMAGLQSRDQGHRAGCDGHRHSDHPRHEEHRPRRPGE